MSSFDFSTILANWAVRSRAITHEILLILVLAAIPVGIAAMIRDGWSLPLVLASIGGLAWLGRRFLPVLIPGLLIPVLVWLLVASLDHWLATGWSMLAFTLVGAWLGGRLAPWESENESRYRSLITAMTEGVVMQNRAGEILASNQAAERILGLSNAQLLGRTSVDPRWRAIHEDGTEFSGETHPAMVALREGRSVNHVVMGVHTPDGALRWIHINAEPLFRPREATPHAVVATFTDITESKRIIRELEQQRRTLQAVLDNIPVAVEMFAAEDMRVLLHNQRAEDLLGRPVREQVATEELNQTYGAYLAGTDTLYPPENMPVVRALRGETTMVEDMELRRPDGSRVDLQVIAAPVRDEQDQITASVVVFRDISEHKKVENARRESEQRLRMAGKAAYDLIYEWHVATGNLEWFGDIETLLGYPPGAIAHRVDAWLALIHPEDAKILADAVERHATSSHPIHYEYRIRHHNGEYRFWKDYGLPMLDAQGRPYQWIGVCTDITAMKRAEEALRQSETHYRTIINTTREGCWVIDPDRRTREVNRALCELLGYQPEEMLGRSPMEFVDDANQAIFRAQMARIHEQDHRHYEIALRAKDGRNLPTLFHASTLRDSHGKLTGSVAFVTDMTRRKQFEAELIRAREAAEAASRAKSSFLANMSHELRTPLNAVLGYAQVLAKHPRLDDETRRMAKTIKSSGDYLLTLLNDVLDLSKVEAGRFELHPTTCRLDTLLRNIAEIFLIQAEHKGLRFHWRIAPEGAWQVELDEKRLRQILLNLLGNAVKFTEHGTMGLCCGHDADWLWFTVHDSGIGIDPAQHAAIFQPFAQTGQENYKIQGTGLGLAISRKLARLMGGDLTVDSRPGQGSIFYLSLPLTMPPRWREAPPEPETTPAITGYERASAQPIRVLIVDDVAENRFLLVEMLEPLGFVLAQAENGEEALAAVASFAPDAILMDLKMPGMDGLEATRRMRAQGHEMPIFAVTASVYPEDRELARAAGCEDLIPKPVEETRLLDTLRTSLALRWRFADVPANAPTALPAEAFDTLTGLVKKGDINQIFAYLETLRQSPETETVAEELLALARAFRLADLKTRLDAMRAGER